MMKNVLLVIAAMVLPGVANAQIEVRLTVPRVRVRVAPPAPRPPPREEVFVEQSPPRNIVERRPPAPFRGAVWIAGFWRWDGSQHDWVAGHWSAPRDNRSAWTPARWRREPARGHGAKARWVFLPGQWKRR